MRLPVAWMALLAALGLGCGSLESPARSAMTQQPIVGGSQDAGALETDVFLIAFTFNNGVNTICSGTLIEAHTVVTAAHCVDPSRQGATSVTIKVTNKPTDQGLLSSDFIAVVDYRINPAWSPAATSADDDIALLLLASAPAVMPREINRASLTGFTGQPITLVGYGRSSASLSDSGIRRSAAATITAVASSSFDFGTAGVLGICSGDSGGATLHDFGGAVRLIGVHSLTTSVSCGSGTDTRIDAHLGFIDQWVLDKEYPADAGYDAGAVDAGVPDAGTPDAGVADAGPRDAGGFDAGAPDAGALDGGPRDAGADAGRADGGTSLDSGSPSVDAGGPPAALGDSCTQGSTRCEPGSVCAAPTGTATTCRRECTADGGCPVAAHCATGEGAVAFCLGDSSAPPDVVVPGPDDGLGPAAGGCRCSDAPFSAGLGWLGVLVLSRVARRRNPLMRQTNRR